MSVTTFEDILEKDGKFIYRNVGKSMLPLIKENRDLIVIAKKEKKPQKYDVPLYLRRDGKYVLHRIVGVLPDGGYVIRGDNCYYTEKNVKDSDIIGVLESIVRKGKEIRVTDTGYRIYSVIWAKTYFIRFIFNKIFVFAARAVRKILRIIGIKK